MGEYRKRTAEELEREIAAARQDLLLTVHELEVVVRNKVDWKQRVAARPLAYFGGALLLGMLIGMR